MSAALSEMSISELSMGAASTRPGQSAAVSMRGPVEGVSKLRLTRRGRLALSSLTALVIGATLAVVAAAGSTSAAASSETAVSSSEFVYVIVQPGQSLWSVASTLDPTADPRDVISEIIRLNQLDESSVQAGQPIAVPLRYSHSEGVFSAQQLGL